MILEKDHYTFENVRCYPNKLFYYRKKNGYSRNYVAEKIGVTERYVLYLETSQRIPSIRIAKSLADLYKTTIEDIFF